MSVGRLHLLLTAFRQNYHRRCFHSPCALSRPLDLLPSLDRVQAWGELTSFFAFAVVAFCCWRRRKAKAGTKPDSAAKAESKAGTGGGKAPLKTDVVPYAQYRKSRLDDIRTDLGLQGESRLRFLSPMAKQHLENR